MSEIKDINKLVIKNSATIELQRRKGFVNILLQGNPNLYRAWVEKNNKIVIDISGESTEYNLDTQTPDYIEITKNQDDNKYYINFVGFIATETLVSDDMTFTQEGDFTRITIKKSKFVSTDRISSGSSDFLYVTVDESGNVSIGLTQETIDRINNIEVAEYVYLPITLNSLNGFGYISHNPSLDNAHGFRRGGFDGTRIDSSEAIGMIQDGSMLKVQINDTGLDYTTEQVVIPNVVSYTDDDDFILMFDFFFDVGYPLILNNITINSSGASYPSNFTKMWFCLFAGEWGAGMTLIKETDWALLSDSEMVFSTSSIHTHYKISLETGAFEPTDVLSLYKILNNMGKLFYVNSGVYYPCYMTVGSNKLYFNVLYNSTVVTKEVKWDSTNSEFYVESDFI